MKISAISIIDRMKAVRFSLTGILFLVTLLSVNARVFDSEKQYESLFGPNVNKGAPVPPPHKMAVYRHKPYVVVTLFEGEASQGELIVRANGQLSETDVINILAVNQGSSAWKKEKVETAKDSNTPQVSLWTRKDGKLFAAYAMTGPTLFLVIGTKRGGDFLIKQKDNLKSYVKS